MLGVELVFCIVLFDKLKRMWWSNGKCVFLLVYLQSVVCLCPSRGSVSSRLESPGRPMGRLPRRPVSQARLWSAYLS